MQKPIPEKALNARIALRRCLCGRARCTVPYDAKACFLVLLPHARPSNANARWKSNIQVFDAAHMPAIACPSTVEPCPQSFLATGPHHYASNDSTGLIIGSGFLALCQSAWSTKAMQSIRRLDVGTFNCVNCVMHNSTRAGAVIVCAEGTAKGQQLLRALSKRP